MFFKNEKNILCIFEIFNYIIYLIRSDILCVSIFKFLRMLLLACYKVIRTILENLLIVAYHYMVTCISPVFRIENMRHVSLF